MRGRRAAHHDQCGHGVGDGLAVLLTEVQVLTEPGCAVGVNQELRHGRLAVARRPDDHEVTRLGQRRQRGAKQPVTSVEHVTDDLVLRVIGVWHTDRQIDDHMLDREPLGVGARLVEVDLAFVG